MRGEIDSNGILSLYRAGTKRKTVCLHRASTCGDGCVFFGEPKKLKRKDKLIRLELCHGKILTFKHLDDLRYDSEGCRQMSMFGEEE